MKISSKQFLALKEQKVELTWIHWITIILSIPVAIIVFGFVIYLTFPWGISISSILILIGVIIDRKESKRMKKIADERKDENICTFTRALNYREIDTVIIRAVYEEISSYVSFPIQPTDRFCEELKIDSEDLEDSIIQIADIIERSLDNLSDNPYYESAYTVEGLIKLLHLQPQI